MSQVYSAAIATAQTGGVLTADALVLDSRTGGAPVGYCILVVDCALVPLASRNGTLTVTIHTGQRGMLDGAVSATTNFLRRNGVEPVNLRAAVGPSVCDSCYEVLEEMLALSVQREPVCASRISWGMSSLDVAAGILA